MSDTTTTVHLKVTGMMCQKSCGSTVENALRALPGATSAQASFVHNYAQVTFSCINSDYNAEEEAVDAVECVGFDAEVLPSSEVQVYRDLQEQQQAQMEQTQHLQPPVEPLSLDHHDNTHNSNNTASFQVGGMSCAVCTGRVEQTLCAIDGVTDASVVLATHTAYVKLSEELQQNESQRQATLQQCVQDVVQAGYECEQLSSSFSSSLNNTESLTDSAQRLERARTHELHTWSRLLIFSTIFTVPLVVLHYLHVSGTLAMVTMWALSTVVQVRVGWRYYRAAYKGWTHGRFLGMDFLVVLGTTASYVYSLVVWGWQVWQPPDSNMLFTLEPTFATGAMLLTFVTLGKFLEAYAKGKTASALQTLMELQPQVALRVDYKDDPETETRTDFSSLDTTEVAAAQVVQGDYVLVLPGARIPADGVLVAVGGGKTSRHLTNTGNATAAYVDESALSGEPFPVSKEIGASVFGSTVNQLVPLLIRVTASGGQTVLAKIVRLVQEASSQKAPIQAQADYIACIFAPTVMVFSVLTFTCWMVFNSNVANTQERFFWAFTSSISVIVVACPCALGLATPTAVMCGTGVGATHGLLIKGGAVLESAHGVDTVVFDKTGTLTTGRAVLGDVHQFPLEPLLVDLPAPVAQQPRNVALWLAACAEKQSEHPLGKAIVNTAQSIWGGDVILSREGVEVSDFYVAPGRGVECVVRQAVWGEWRVRVGSREWAHASLREEDDIPLADNNERIGDKEVMEMRHRGQIAVYVSVISQREWLQKVDSRGRTYERNVVGVIGIVDPIEAEARSTVAALQKMGVDVWLCTGDHEVTARSVARQVGIDDENVCAGVTPEGKADLVTRLQKKERTATNRHRRGKRQAGRRHQKGRVAVVGDGINDAVALARADVGVAIGAGTEVAVEAADMVLVRSSLHDVVVAMHLSHVVFQRIRLNFVWALGYNIIALPFAAGAFYPFTSLRLPPEFAGLMMAFSSVSVVTSSLLLRAYSRPEIKEDGSLKTHGCLSSGLVGAVSCCFGSLQQPAPLLSRVSGPSYEDVATEDSFRGDSLEMV